MSKKKTPLERVKEEFKSKETLVDRVIDLVEHGAKDKDKDEFKARLLATSNRKLLRLFEVAREMKSRFGDRQKLAETIAQLVGKMKDKDYVAKLTKLTPPRLMSLYTAVERRAKRTQKQA